jgi:Flp pilus assembly protein TadD
MAAQKKQKREAGKKAASAKSQAASRKRMPPAPQAGQHIAADAGTYLKSIPPKAGCIMLAALCLLIYAYSLNGGMVNFDDAIVTHSWKKNLSWQVVKKEFFRFRGTYQPMRNLSHILDHELFGKNLWGYRLHSLVLYTLNVLLAYAFLLFLIKRYPLVGEIYRPPGKDPTSTKAGVPSETIALLIAALFAAHPVHVEAVAWLSARKEVLFGLFYFLSLLLYVKKEEWEKWKRLSGYLGAFFCYLLALISKPSAASLPFVLLAYDLILLRPEKKTWKTRFLYHLPFWLPLGGAIFYFALKAGTTDTAWATLNLYEQMLTSQKTTLKYLEILFLPVNLSARYFIPPGRSLLDPGVFVGALVNLSMLVIFIRTLRRNPLIAFAIAWFYLNWLPTAGLVPISTKAADRYLFLSLLGFSILLAALALKLFSWFAQTGQGRQKAIAYGAVPCLVVVIFALSIATVMRSRVWKDEKTLWEDMARKSPTDLSLIHMAQYHMKRNEWREAEHYYWQALELNPLDGDAWNNLGNVLILQNRPKEAEEAFKRVLKLQPHRREVLKNMAVAYVMQRSYGDAEKNLTEYLSENSEDYSAWDLIADVRIMQKHFEAALEAAQRMAELEPDKAKAYIFMAESFRQLGKEEEAKRAYEKALALDPDLARAYSKKLGP